MEIVVCGCVKKTQIPKGERVGLQFNLFTYDFKRVA
jgi:hypothetical protein